MDAVVGGGCDAEQVQGSGVGVGDAGSVKLHGILLL